MHFSVSNRWKGAVAETVVKNYRVCKIKEEEKAPTVGVKHRRGQIRMKPTEIKDETHKRNVVW